MNYKIKIIKNLIILLISLLLCILVFQIIYPRFSYNMKYVKPTTYLGVQYKYVYYKYSKQEIKNKLEDIIDVDYYIYIETELNDNINGCTNLMFRYILIDKDLSQLDYIETMCHELIHLKYNTGNERFTQYQTFITLYNSEFRQVALNIIYYMENGYYYYDYDCYSQIVDYLL